MTNHPTQTPPFVPIVVLSHRKDDCKVLVAGEVFAGNTLRAAIVKATGVAIQSEGGKA